MVTSHSTKKKYNSDNSCMFPETYFHTTFKDRSASCAHFIVSRFRHVVLKNSRKSQTVMGP